MNITILTRIVTLLTALLLTLSALLFLQNRHYIPPLPVLYAKWHDRLFSHEIDSLHTLYTTRTNKPVTVAVPLNNEIVKRTLEGLKFHLNTVLDIEKVDGKIVKYVLQTTEDGERHFKLDPKSGKLQGAFKTFKHIADDGTIVVKLVPVNPRWVKGS